VCTLSFAHRSQTPEARGSGAVDSSYVPVLKFDPKRDAAADIRAAVGEAQRTGKRILLDVGGDWCTWCRVFDEFFAQHPDIARLRDDNFITVAVFYSHENKNEKVLSSYPQVEGIPHFFVLEKDGTLLYSQGIVKIETGGEPDPEKIMDFLLKWSIHPSR
jgi:hypothetical protein